MDTIGKSSKATLQLVRYYITSKTRSMPLYVIVL